MTGRLDGERENARFAPRKAWQIARWERLAWPGELWGINATGLAR